MHTIKLSETSPTAQRQSQHRGFCSPWTVFAPFKQVTKILKPTLQSELIHFTSPFFAAIFIPAASSQKGK